MEDMEVWFKSREKWLQSAVALRLSNVEPAPEDYKVLAKLCLKEAGDTLVADAFQVIPKGSISHTDTSKPLRLVEIKNITGINALSPDKPLTFGKSPITIIYGDTGTGKSGYSRLLKHACGSRFAGELYGDAFKATPADQAASFVVDVAGTTTELAWKKKSGPSALLTQVHVFDTECASSYLAKPNEPAFEPFIIRLLSEIIEDCDTVKARLVLEKGLLPSKLPIMPEGIKDGVRSAWYVALTAKTSTSAIEENCAFAEADLAEATALEIELNKLNPKEEMTRAQKMQTNATVLSQDLDKWHGQLSASVGEKIRALRATATARRNDSEEAAAKIFESAPLEGIGAEQWRRMWEAAQKYSEEVAYKGHPFPVTTENAVCVLCQQKLTDGRARLIDFESFFKNAVEAAAKAAQNNLDDAIKAVPTIPDLSGMEGRFDAAGSLITDAPSLHAAMTQRREWILSNSTATAPDCNIQISLEEMAALKTSYANEIQKLKELESNTERLKKFSRLKDLRVRQWLFPQLAAINDEIQRLQRTALIDRAIGLTVTTGLTAKKNSLSEDLLASGHKARFEVELKALHGDHLPVKVNHSKAAKSAKPGFSIGLTNTKQDIPLQSVLSEGQNRVVALASFFADVTAGAKDVPFIFDDPISSLDQDYEESTATRLVAESKHRQVIIFTHRLSLLASVTEAAKKAGFEVEIKAIRGRPFGQGTPHDSFLNGTNPEKALNTILNDHIPKAQKALDAGEITVYDMHVKSICSDFRIVQERTIEKVLLNDVIERFRRPIHTKDKLDELTKIEGADCSLMDGLMTKYSVSEHSQSLQAPALPYTLPEIKADVEGLIAWIKAFKARKTIP